MGKNAKIRKKRREQTGNAPDLQQSNANNFIQQIEKTGYRKERIQRSPDVPKENIEPII